MYQLGVGKLADRNVKAEEPRTYVIANETTKRILVLLRDNREASELRDEAAMAATDRRQEVRNEGS